MYFIALAADYDGTIAHDSIVDDATFAALKRVKDSGRRLLLVTGRELEDLQKVFPHYDIFDRIVAENGALIFDPVTRRERLIGTPPPPQFAEVLKQKGVSPLSIGCCIVATWEPNEKIVLETIRDLGLGLQIIHNKGAVMVLPAGIDKATGLQAALRELGLSPHKCVGAGDGENDIDFLNLCGCPVAVANALPAVKEAAHIILKGARGEGVAELAAQICRNDKELIPRQRHGIPVGTGPDGDASSRMIGLPAK